MSDKQSNQAIGAEGAYEGILVLGFSRSGTTLTRRLLNAHPNLCCPPETHLLHASARFLEEQTVSRGLKLGVLAGCTYAGIPAEEVLERLRGLAFGMFRDICAKEGKPNAKWVDKTPANMFQIDTLERLCGPRCRYICLIRHPLDVICSLRELSNETENYLFEIHDYIRIYNGPLVAFAHAWADCYKRSLKFQQEHPDLCVRLRYEDLVADPAGNLDRIFTFLREPADGAKVVEKAMAGRDTIGLGDYKTYQKSSISDSSVGRHRDLSPQTIQRLLDIVGPVMAEYGYDVSPPENVADTEQARRNHVLGLMSSKLMAEARAKKT
jgi:protein-tyrosine sulfotransferase